MTGRMEFPLKRYADVNSLYGRGYRTATIISGVSNFEILEMKGRVARHKTVRRGVWSVIATNARRPACKVARRIRHDH